MILPTCLISIMYPPPAGNERVYAQLTANTKRPKSSAKWEVYGRAPNPTRSTSQVIYLCLSRGVVKECQDLPPMRRNIFPGLFTSGAGRTAGCGPGGNGSVMERNNVTITCVDGTYWLRASEAWLPIPIPIPPPPTFLLGYLCPPCRCPPPLSRVVRTIIIKKRIERNTQGESLHPPPACWSALAPPPRLLKLAPRPVRRKPAHGPTTLRGGGTKAWPRVILPPSSPAADPAQFTDVSYQ